MHSTPPEVMISTPEDFEGWLALAREVEPLFGPMADQPAFQAALRQAIQEKCAYCIRDAAKPQTLGGGVLMDPRENEIAWLAVARRSRGQGYGEALLQRALRSLRPEAAVVVTTFDPAVPEGLPARRLYLKHQFRDFQKGEINPAGIPTMLMRREPYAE